MTKKLLLVLAIACLSATAPALAQQTGSVSGRVTSPEGEPLPGVTVEARGEVLPQPRVTTTSESGRYSLPQLPPGRYDLEFSLQGMASVTQRLTVLLQQNSVVDVALSLEGFEEEIRVLGEAPLIDSSSAEIKNSISNETLAKLPVGQQYRDLVKFIPGVQYTEETTRGPSAGGHGQDNVHLFDGVDVGLPLFGTLATEPSSHDVDQVAIVKGGAKATDFNRAGGFTINTVSKSGTNQYHGELSYQLQSEDMTSDQKAETAAEFDEDKDWAVASIGGPVVRDQLFFYGSYFRPTTDRANRSNLYGEVPDLDDTRDEYFGKLTWSPTGSMLLHGSYRDSDHPVRGTGVTEQDSHGSTSTGSDTTIEIAIAEGTWVTGSNSFLSAKFTDYTNENSSGPDNVFGFSIADDGSVGLDVNNLDQMGLFDVPVPLPGESEFNAFIAPLLERYGYLDNGQRVGGGLVGGGSTFNDQDFFRESYQAGFDYTLGENVSHELHVGYRFSKNEEDLNRLSNGWGFVSVPGGRDCLPGPGQESVVCEFGPNGTPLNGTQIFYQTVFQQGSLGQTPGTSIRSSFESQDVELNDTIRWNNWTFNAGVLLSNDTYFGQGLRPNSANISGFEVAPGHKYEMYDIGFDEMIQPRLGAIWTYNDRDTLFANVARYHPAATSLPRAASWDRANLGLIMEGYFDAQGNLLEVVPRGSSSGKFFADGLEPRSIDEYMIGTSRQLSDRWTGRAYARHRYGGHFWEDTNNDARVSFQPPPHIPQELYIPNLDEVRAEIGGSSYVIAELDDAFSKFYEVSLESDYRGENIYFNGSLVWSHYYGNIDQDNTTTDNDQAIFIGSSNIADGGGRQTWDLKYGNLRGDRRYLLKLFGSYTLPWDASVGAFAVYQDGQPWEAWNVQPYRDSGVTGSSISTSRFSEAAGSRRTDDHYQLDLNYTHNLRFGGRYNVQLAADLYNLFDKQTGYDANPFETDPLFGQPRRHYRPRRLQLAARFQF